MTIDFTIHQIEFTIHKVQKFHIRNEKLYIRVANPNILEIEASQPRCEWQEYWREWRDAKEYFFDDVSYLSVKDDTVIDEYDEPEELFDIDSFMDELNEAEFPTISIL